MSMSPKEEKAEAKAKPKMESLLRKANADNGQRKVSALGKLNALGLTATPQRTNARTSLALAPVEAKGHSPLLPEKPASAKKLNLAKENHHQEKLTSLLVETS